MAVGPQFKRSSSWIQGQKWKILFTEVEFLYFLWIVFPALEWKLSLTALCYDWSDVYWVCTAVKHSLILHHRTNISLQWFLLQWICSNRHIQTKQLVVRSLEFREGQNFSFSVFFCIRKQQDRHIWLFICRCQASFPSMPVTTEPFFCPFPSSSAPNSSNIPTSI